MEFKKFVFAQEINDLLDDEGIGIVFKPTGSTKYLRRTIFSRYRNGRYASFLNTDESIAPVNDSLPYTLPFILT